MRRALSLLLRTPSQAARWGEAVRACWALTRAWLMGLCVALLLAAGARAQGIELKSLALERREGELTLEFNTRLTLGPAIEDALQRGVPMYFVAQTVVFRNRWYWRDERVARVTRSWRVAFQPLTGSWRVSQVGGLSQSYASLSEASDNEA